MCEQLELQRTYLNSVPNGTNSCSRGRDNTLSTKAVDTKNQHLVFLALTITSRNVARTFNANAQHLQKVLITFQNLTRDTSHLQAAAIAIICQGFNKRHNFLNCPVIANFLTTV